MSYYWNYSSYSHSPLDGYYSSWYDYSHSRFGYAYLSLLQTLAAKQRDFGLWWIIPPCITVSFAFAEVGSFCLVRRWIGIVRRFWQWINDSRHFHHSNNALNAAINFVVPYTAGHNSDNDSRRRPPIQKWTFFWTSHVAVISACQSQYVWEN